MTRFFVPPERIDGQTALLDEDDAHHLRVVLKLEPGDSISVLDGSGAEWRAVITAIGKRSASARLIDQTWPQTEAVTQITIAQALPKMNEKMEQVLQRGTEIGVHAFRAFNSARSLPHLAGERQEKRLQRWTAIVKTAAEQSHRALLPSIAATDTYNDILASAPQYDLTLLAYEGEHERSLKTVLRSLPTPSRSVLVIVGPESGLTEDEARCAETAGAIPVTLGPRILRTETAAMIAAAQILYEWED